ncbi:MAG: glycosyltransferase family 2 protein, partial [Roseiarcus sp.]
MLADVEVPIVIVGFGNADDIVKCLTAIGDQRGCPRTGVFICENGGADAFDALVGALSSPGGPCAGDAENADLEAPVFLRIRRLRLAAADIPVFVGLA